MHFPTFPLFLCFPSHVPLSSKFLSIFPSQMLFSSSFFFYLFFFFLFLQIQMSERSNWECEMVRRGWRARQRHVLSLRDHTEMWSVRRSWGAVHSHRPVVWLPRKQEGKDEQKWQAEEIVSVIDPDSFIQCRPYIP